MKRLLKMGLTLGIVASCILSSIGVSAYYIPKTVIREPYRYVPKVDSQGNFYVPQTLATGNPTVSSGGWINPTNAYANGGGYADILSGSPSASEIYNGFGFAYYGSVINQVRVRVDAWCVGITQSKTVYPTSDYGTATGTWAISPTSPTTYWDKVDEASSDGDSTYELEGTTAGYRMFGFASPSLLSNITIQNVTVTIIARDNTSGTNKIQPALRIGGTNYLTTSTSTEVPVSYGTISYSYTTNPKTGTAWTVADVNGTGTNPLQYFGTNSADANPQIRITQVIMTVNYTTYPDEKMNLYDSWDGGTTWSSAHSIQLTNAEVTYWTDVTSDTAWDYFKLLDTNFRIKVEAVTVGDVSDVRLDYLTTEVTNTAGANVTQVNANTYQIGLSKEPITVGSSATSFSPVFTLPRWENNDWAASMGFTLAVAGNALASTFASSSFSVTSGSVTASNNYMTLVYSGTSVTPNFNETGGMDLNIVVKQNVGTTLAFGYNSTNVNAYLQPSLTKEWTVGQDLGDGRTVASVTDTDVTDNLGNNVAHRPDYVVNAIAFMNATNGGMVSDVQASTGLTTGQIGMLYNLNVTGANGVKGKAYWSLPNANTLWLTFDPTGMTYPIVLSPAGDTFGYTSIGGSDFNYISVGCLFTTGSAASSITNIKAALKDGGEVGDWWEYSFAIYDASQNRVSVDGSGWDNESQDPGTSYAWCTSTHSFSGTLSASTNYYLWCGRYDDRSDYPQYIAYTSGATNQSVWDYFEVSCASDWPSTITPFSSLNYKMSIYCTYTASETYNLTNSPSSIDFGVIQPNTKYYAYGSAPSNPITDGQCTFTITNGQANAIKVNIQATNFTGGGGWTLGTPDSTHARLIAYTSGSNPASGVTLTTSPQTFVASLAGSATIKWDFSFETATAFADGTQKSSTIQLTGVAP